jgi:hypothetical protein
MKNIYLLAIIAALLFVGNKVLCAQVLISVELPTIESKKAWHQLNIPTYELIGNTAIAEIEESKIASLKQKGFQANIIDRQPGMAKCMIVSDYDKVPVIKETSIWQNAKMAIIKPASKDIYLSREYKPTSGR